MPLRFSAASDTGLVRSRNEDSFLLIPGRAGAFLAVADGIGGYKAGEVASRIATRTVGRMFREEGQAGPPDRQRLLQSFQTANQEILRARSRSPNPDEEMGTTLTCVWVEGRRCLAAHVGDSRLYRFRHGRLDQLTEDHSVVGELVRKGKVRREDAMSHPQRHLLTNALGLGSLLSVDVTEEDLGLGDVLLLCTDGLTGALTEEEISQVLRDGFDRAAERLVAEANRAGGGDNVTVVMVAIEASDIEKVADV